MALRSLWNTLSGAKSNTTEQSPERSLFASRIVGTGSHEYSNSEEISSNDLTTEDAVSSEIDSASTSHIASSKSPRSEHATTSPSATSSSVKYARFEAILESKNPVDLAKLRKLSWNGIPNKYRPIVWQLLLGYRPTVKDRINATISRKRREYWQCVDQFMAHNDSTLEMDQVDMRSVLMDIPRTAPEIPILHSEPLQTSLKRILYTWARRHPASGYVQGINDLASAFYVVFLSPLTDLNEESVEHIEQEELKIVEADVYWCLTKMVDRIQDHYTPSQPGIQRMVSRLRELCFRLDPSLVTYIESLDEGFGFMELTFRWMNCLLMRELPMRLILRLWDTYFSEDRGVEQFHVYVCAALLLHFSKELKEMEFHELVTFAQHLPTNDWSVQQLDELLSYAYIYKSSFEASDAHLPGQQ